MTAHGDATMFGDTTGDTTGDKPLHRGTTGDKRDDNDDDDDADDAGDDYDDYDGDDARFGGTRCGNCCR